MPSDAHRDAVRHGDGVEDHRLGAGAVDAGRGRRGQLVDVHVAGRDLAPRRADADLRLGEVVAREADGVEHGAPGGARRAVDDGGGARRGDEDADAASDGSSAATVSSGRGCAIRRSRRGAGIIRLDVWLDVACLFRTRSEAQKACRNGKVDVNGTTAKPHREVRVGDTLAHRAAARPHADRVRPRSRRPPYRQGRGAGALRRPDAAAHRRGGGDAAPRTGVPRHDGAAAAARQARAAAAARTQRRL